MTVGQFRSDPGLVKQWEEELKTNGLLKLVLFDVMEQAHPARYAVTSDEKGDISATRAAIELGATRGYSRYGDTLKLLAKPAPKPNQELPESQYANPNEE